MTDYINIGAMLSAICLIVAWMFITSRHHYTIKMVASVIAVALAIGIWTQSTALIGFPVHGLPPDGSVVLALQVDSSEIAFWIDGRPPRSYVIPYDPELAKKLQSSQDQARATGGRMIFHIDGKSGGNGSGGKDANGGQSGQGGRSPGGNGTRFEDNSPRVHIDVVPAMPDK